MTNGSSEPFPLRRRLGHLVGLGLFLLLLGLWLANTAGRPDLLNRDWVAFDNAGWRALGGNWASVYTSSADERWAYLYPPYVLVLSLPLGLVPFWPSYVLSVAMGLAGVVWSCRRLRDIVGFAEGRLLVFASALLCAPTTLQVFITGQYSWLYLMGLAGLAAYWHQGDDRRAGLSLALLAVKPNVALLVLPLLVLRRRWATLRAAALAFAVSVAVTLPLTLFAWGRFLDAVRGVAERQETGEAPIEKQVTLLSFFRVVSGDLSGSVAIWLLWFVVAAALGALVAWTWWRAGADTPPLRLVGLAALAIVALSPRLYFYDALVLAVPAASWYLGRDGYRRRWTRRVQGGCLAAIVVITFVFFPVPSVGTVVGPLAALWLLGEALDILAAPAARRAAPLSSDDDLILAS